MDTAGKLIGCVVINLGEGLRRGKGRKGKGREGKGREGKGREGKERKGKEGMREERKGEGRKVQRNCYFITNTHLFVYMLTK